MKDNRTSIKRSLVTSAVALVLTAALLIGTTFAWFTSTAQAGVNKIESGTLEVKIVDATDETTEISNLDWQKAAGHETEAVLWEPGATYSLQKFKIKNTGNLALKCKMNVSGVDGDTGLLKVLTFTYKLGENTYSLGDEIKLTSNATSDTIIVSATMDTNATNDYRNMTLDGIQISVIATQDTVESDSKDNQYDKDALYPDVAYQKVANTTELTNLLANPTDAAGNPTTKVAAELGEGTYTLPAITNKTVTIYGNENTVIDMTASSMIGAQNGNLDLTVVGATVKFANENYKGISHSKAVTYKDCTIEGRQTLYADTVNFSNCTFVNKNDYCIWTYGAKDVTFDNCVFETGGKAILIYNEYTNTNFAATVKVNGCTFNDDDTISNATKAAIETGSNANNTQSSNKYEIIVTSTTVNGFAVNNEGISSNSTVWANKNSMDKDHLSVTIDGQKVY